MKNSIYHMYSIPRNRIGENLTQFEREHILNLSGDVDLSPSLFPKRFHQFSFVEMNSTYIELIDGYFYNIGRSVGIGGGLLFTLVSMAVALNVFLLFLLLPHENGGESFGFLFYCILFSLLFLSFYMVFKNIKAFQYYEFNGYYYLPIRFNRKTNKLYLYSSDGEQVERKPNLLVFAISANKGFLDAKDYALSAFELDKDGIIIRHYAIGQSSYHLENISQLWEFIRVYWIKGPDPLMPKHIKDHTTIYDRKSYLVYCNDVKNKEAKAIDSWRRIRLSHDRNIFFEILGFPFDVLHFLGRRACLKYRTIPQWSAEIETRNICEENDSCQINSKKNYHYKYFSIEENK